MQFSETLQQSLQVVAIAMAAYGDGFKRHNSSTARALSSVLHSGKYVIDPELRAKRIVELTQHTSIPFCKAFWSLTDNHGMQVNVSDHQKICYIAKIILFPNPSRVCFSHIPTQK